MSTYHKKAIGLIASALFAGTLSVPAFALDHVNVHLDWLPTGDKAFLYAGVKEGIYKKAGLDVEISPGRSAPDAVTQVATGNADIGATGINALMEAYAHGGVPVKAVMSVYTKPPEAVFTYQGSGITDLKSALGKSMAYSMTSAPWPGVLRKAGLDPDKVKMVNVSPASLEPMLAQGRVDMNLNWVTKRADAESLMKRAGKQLKVIPLSNMGLQGYAYSIVASQKMITSRPDVLKRFVAATQQAIQFSIQHPEQAAKDLSSVVPESNLQVLEGEWKDSIPLIDNSISQKDGLGAFNSELLQTTWRWVADSDGYKTNAISPQEVVDTQFVTPLHLK